MAESNRALLLRTLLANYHALRDQLARRLRSADLAADALHDVWRRLEAGEDLGPVERPEGYLYKAALNAAKNLLRKANRQQTLAPVDIAALADIADEAPDPATVLAAREAMTELQAALKELPLRQQVVFHETFLGDATQPELARRFNVTVRTIQNDLRQSVEHCVRRLRKFHFVAGRRGLSGK